MQQTSNNGTGLATTRSSVPHRLSQVNETEKTGVCSVCGPVQLRPKGHRPNGSRRWDCSQTPHNLHDKCKPWGESSSKRVRRQRKIEREGITDTVCAICGAEPERDRALAIDHDHVTGKVRGLLCAPCNLALGLLEDNIEILEAAIDYLRERG